MQNKSEFYSLKYVVIVLYKILGLGIVLLFLAISCIPGVEPDESEETNLDTKEDPTARSILDGQLQLPELPAVDKKISQENQLIIDEFREQAEAICDDPCVIPEKETDTLYKLRDAERNAIEEHTVRMHEEGQDSEVVRLKHTIINGNLYVRSILYSDKPADFYMLKSIRQMDERLADMPTEMLLPAVQVLTIQIRNRNDALENFNNGMYGAYGRFAKSEIRVLIQLRRRMLDEIRNRNP